MLLYNVTWASKQKPALSSKEKHTLAHTAHKQFSGRKIIFMTPCPREEATAAACAHFQSREGGNISYIDAVTIGTPKEGTLEIRSCVSKVLPSISCSVFPSYILEK